MNTGVLLHVPDLQVAKNSISIHQYIVGLYIMLVKQELYKKPTQFFGFQLQQKY